MAANGLASTPFSKMCWRMPCRKLMSTMPDVKIIRGGAVGNSAKTSTAMKLMARNQLRKSLH